MGIPKESESIRAYDTAEVNNFWELDLLNSGNLPHAEDQILCRVPAYM
jgi:hypothetical protein